MMINKYKHLIIIMEMVIFNLNIINLKIILLLIRIIINLEQINLWPIRLVIHNNIKIIIIKKVHNNNTKINIIKQVILNLIIQINNNLHNKLHLITDMKELKNKLIRVYYQKDKKS